MRRLCGDEDLGLRPFHLRRREEAELVLEIFYLPIDVANLALRIELEPVRFRAAALDQAENGRPVLSPLRRRAPGLRPLRQLGEILDLCVSAAAICASSVAF